MNAHLRDREDGKAEGMPAAQSSDVLAAQNDMAVRTDRESQPDRVEEHSGHGALFAIGK